MSHTYPNIPECFYRISVKAILRNPEGKFAMCLKEMLINGEMQTKWDIPGGGIDHGEDIFEALIREVHEETGLTVTHIEKHPKYFFIAEFADRSKPLGLVCYETVVENFDYTPSDECREMRFFSLDEALQADTFSGVKTSLETAKKMYGEF